MIKTVCGLCKNIFWPSLIQFHFIFQQHCRLGLSGSERPTQTGIRMQVLLTVNNFFALCLIGVVEVNLCSRNGWSTSQKLVSPESVWQWPNQNSAQYGNVTFVIFLRTSSNSPVCLHAASNFIIPPLFAFTIKTSWPSLFQIALYLLGAREIRLPGSERWIHRCNGM
jgi:hypothetical protein